MEAVTVAGKRDTLQWEFKIGWGVSLDVVHEEETFSNVKMVQSPILLFVTHVLVILLL